MKKKLIYVVEDDYYQAQWTLDLLREEFGETIEVERIATHHGFLEKFREIAEKKPACIILDVMLPWTDTEISEEPTSLDSFMTAGIQCQQRLKGDERTAKIPVLIYTVLDRGDLSRLPAGTAHLRKDAPDSKLIEWVENVLATA